MNKILRVVLTVILGTTLLVGCADQQSGGQNEDSLISVISREDGSGTRGAFTELIKIEEKDVNGNKIDHTTKEATIAPKTDVMLANVSGDELAIGYISLGSLNDSIKAMKIDGVEPSPENIKSGAYKVARPFNIATKGEPTGVAKDFIAYILSAEGQAVVAESYISIADEAPQYAGSQSVGKIVVAGSSSVTPIMEKLKEAYELVNSEAEIEIQLSDSTSGMNGTMEGICDIGMASRSLKESENEVLNSMEIAIDGIVVIANKVNTIDDLSTQNVKDIFTGAVTKWREVK